LTDAYQPGDVIISEISLSSPRGYVNLLLMFASMKLFESIYVPNTLLELTVWDINDVIGNMVFLGDELITTSFSSPGGTVVNYTFALDTITDVTEEKATKSKSYVLHGVGVETMYAKTNYVQKQYNQPISSIVSDIHSNFLMSSKSLGVEATNSEQNIMIPNYDPFKAIDMVRRRAVSASNPSSTYVYFENALGMYFKTIEGMLQQSPIKYFVRLDTNGTSIFNQTENNIISLAVPQIVSSTERISLGSLTQRISTYNVRTRKYTYKDVQPPSSSYNSSAFTSKYGGKYGMNSVIPVDTANRPFTSIDSMTPNQMAFTAKIMQTQLNLRVFGDGIVKAGDVINVEIPQIVNITGNIPSDPLLAGNYLVSRICRSIGTSLERPRYTDSIECINGDLGQGS
jgi:hypothetical protein